MDQYDFPKYLASWVASSGPIGFESNMALYINAGDALNKNSPKYNRTFKLESVGDTLRAINICSLDGFSMADFAAGVF